MPSTTKSSTSREKVRAHRARLRAKGLRPIQIWVPDVRSKDFRSRAHAQCLAVSQSTSSQHDQAFIDAVSEFNQS